MKMEHRIRDLETKPAFLSFPTFATTIVVNKVDGGYVMPVLSVRMSEEEYKTLEAYAKTHGVSLNKAIKDAFFDMLEDQYDLEVFDKAYAAYQKDPVTYTSDEVEKELGIK
jgi:hypothetical protein